MDGFNTTRKILDIGDLKQRWRLLDFIINVVKILLLPIINFVSYLGCLTIIFLDSFFSLPRIIPWRRNSKWKYVLGQLSRIGYDALPIVVLLSFLLGVVIALQSAKQLERFGASVYVADLVALSLSREIIPIMISLIIAGRTGSAIASEIGTMVVSEEIVALRSMGINAVSILVMPKMVAMVVGLPCMVLVGDFIGIIGGFCVGCFLLDISYADYYNQTVKVLTMDHLWSGLEKCFAFAIVITAVGSYRGFNVTNGADGVGKAATNAVVESIILIITINSLFTFVSYYAR